MLRRKPAYLLTALLAMPFSLKSAGPATAGQLLSFLDDGDDDDWPECTEADRLANLRACKIKAFDQSVTVENILARSVPGYGEFYRFLGPAATQLGRLKEKVGLLARLADRYHAAAHFKKESEQTGQSAAVASPGRLFKKGHKNHVTRLLTDEFSFYTHQSAPLTSGDFAELLGYVEHLATDLHPNLTLVLSSFAVLQTDGFINNVVVHVQCGTLPSIAVFAKTCPDPVDLLYPNTQNASAHCNDEFKGSQSAPTILSYPDGSLGLPRDSVVGVQTEGAARYYDAIDICLDHAYGVAKRNLHKELASWDVSVDSATVLPGQVSHILTSASIYRVTSQQIGSFMVQADPDIDTVAPDQRQLQRRIKGTHLAALAREFIAYQDTVADHPDCLAYADLSTPTRTLIALHCPYFGGGIELSFLEPHTLERLPRVDADHSPEERSETSTEPRDEASSSAAEQFSAQSSD